MTKATKWDVDNRVQLAPARVLFQQSLEGISGTVEFVDEDGYIGVNFDNGEQFRVRSEWLIEGKHAKIKVLSCCFVGVGTPDARIGMMLQVDNETGNWQIADEHGGIVTFSRELVEDFLLPALADNLNYEINGPYNDEENDEDSDEN